MNYHHNQNQMQRNQPSIQPISEMYNLDSILGNFQYAIGTPHQEIENSSPAICKAVAWEIQKQAQEGRPVRVNLFNYLSQNAYNTQEFRNFCGVVIARVTLGMVNRESNSVFNMANEVVSNLVRWFSAFAACQNNDVLACCTHDVVAQLHKDAKQWERQARMTAGEVPYEPFGVSRMSETLGNSNSSVTGTGMHATRNSGAFVPTGTSQRHYTPNANNAERPTNRFQAQLQKRMNMLEGSMQQSGNAMLNRVNSAPIRERDESTEHRHATASTVRQRQLDRILERNGQPPRHQGPMAAATPAPVAYSFTPPTGKASFGGFQEQDTAAVLAEQGIEYEDASAPVAAPAVEVPKPQSFIMTLMVDGVEYGVVRKIDYEKRGDFVWRANRTQMVHPAWLLSKHKIVYCELENGDWVAVLIEEELNKEAIVFKYEAHSIDPTKGIPAPFPTEPPPLPPKESEVTYEKKSPAEFTKIMHVAVNPDNIAVATEENLMNNTDDVVAGLDRKPDGYLRQASVVDTVRYETREEMLGDLAAIKGFAVASDWASLLPMIDSIKSVRTRKAVVERFTNSVNTWLKTRLGVTEFIDNFVDDALELVEYIRGEYGEKAGIALDRDMIRITFDSFVAEDGSDRGEIIESINGLGSGANTDTTLVFFRDVAALRLQMTNEELDLGVPDEGVAVIGANHTGLMNALLANGFGSIHKTNNMEYIGLVTRDGIRYRVAKGALSPEVFLISQW